MLTVRRLYVYLVSAASLALLVTGLAGAGATVIELLLRGGALEPTYRATIALFGAEILVATPLWVLHWRFAQRLAAGDAAERAAPLRRLYLYAALAALLAAAGGLAISLVDDALGIALGVRNLPAESTTIGLLRTLWELAVVLAFWSYALRIADADRAAVGESGSSATLRRWYTYASQVVALLVGLFGAAALLNQLLVDVFARAIVVGAGRAVAGGVARTLVGLGIWAYQRRRSSAGALIDEDRHSTLRAVAGFGVVAVAILETLLGVGQMLYWTVARLLGVPRPSGLPGDALAALGGALAGTLVFGTAWVVTRRDLARDAAGTEGGRQAGVRRLYEHLVALVALATLASGAALLLWALVDQLMEPGVSISPTDFRDRVSLAVTFMVVGLPVWLLHWRPAAPDEERRAFSRRLYIFASLLVSALAGLGSGIWLASQLLRMLLAVPSSHRALDLGHALGLLIVAAAVAAYHARVLRKDAALRTVQTDQPAPPAAAIGAGPIDVEITGATEDEIRAALAVLPSGANYEIRAR